MLRTNEGTGDFFAVSDEPTTQPAAPKSTSLFSLRNTVGLIVVMFIIAVGYGSVRQAPGRAWPKKRQRTKFDFQSPGGK
jgi:hypothetical protein